MRVGFVLRSAEIKPLFYDLFIESTHIKILVSSYVMLFVHTIMYEERLRGSTSPPPRLCNVHLMYTHVELLLW